MSKAKERAFFDDEFSIESEQGVEAEVKEEPKKKGRKKKAPDPRINMAFYDDNLTFCQFASWKKRQSITQFVNALIEQEKAKYNKEDWEKFAEEVND